ncbi:MAG: SurA N-terminal domain-containing protein [Christensenellales bacterium]|jgi:hypothetical protein
MNKYKIIAVVIVCILIFTGCSLVRIDENKVANLVVATVNGKDILRYHVNENTVRYYVQVGLSESGLTEEDLRAAELKKVYDDQRNQILDKMVLNELLLQKAPELGVTLTDEEKKANLKSSEEIFEAQKKGIRIRVEEEFGITSADSNIEETDTDTSVGTPTPSLNPVDMAAVEAEIERRYQEFLDDFGYTTETYPEFLNNQTLISKVGEYIRGLAEVTDAQVKNWYDQTLVLQQERMDGETSAFSSTVTGKQIYTYVPRDTVAVKQVFLAFDDTDLVEGAQTLYGDGHGDEAMALLQSEIDALMPTALEIHQRLLDGENIDDLIAEYGEDESMTTEPKATYGYFVESRTVANEPEFNKAALAMTNVGEISEPFATRTGVHILQCVNIYKQGVVPFDDLKDKIKQALLPSRQNEYYNETTQKWLDEADVVYYRDRLDIKMES